MASLGTGLSSGPLGAGTVEQVAGRVAALHPGRRVRVGVDGVDGAGKTTFATALVLAVQARGRPAVAVSEDGFHRPRAERWARGRHDPEGFYRDSYDDEALVQALLAPFGPAGDGRYLPAVHDVASDRPVLPRPHTAAADEVLVVDGLFLQRPALRGCFGLVVFLDVPWHETYRRMAERDGCPPDPDHPANRRYRLGQQLYLDECHPVERADVVVRGRWRGQSATASAPAGGAGPVRW